jgi:hypothetical protein
VAVTEQLTGAGVGVEFVAGVAVLAAAMGRGAPGNRRCRIARLLRPAGGGDGRGGGCGVERRWHGCTCRLMRKPAQFPQGGQVRRSRGGDRLRRQGSAKGEEGAVAAVRRKRGRIWL